MLDIAFSKPAQPILIEDKQPEKLLKAQSYIVKILEVGSVYYNEFETQDKKPTTYVLDQDIVMQISNDLINRYVTIDHFPLQSDTIDNVDDNKNIVGIVTDVFYNDKGFTLNDGTEIAADNASYAIILIDRQRGIDYINDGYLPSITYQIIDQKDLEDNKAQVINGLANHLALVENPKYNTIIYDNNMSKSTITATSGQNAKIVNNGTVDMKEEKKLIDNNESDVITTQEEISTNDLNNMFVRDSEGNEYSMEEIIALLGEEINND